MKRWAMFVTVGMLAAGAIADADAKPKRPYVVVDTGQQHIFSDTGQLTRVPKPGQAFYGQDGQYAGPQPDYRDNKDGTISDLNTGLMWVKSPEMDNLPTFAQAKAGASACRVGGYDDWRLPTVKELYSLIDFNGNVRASKPVPYIDTKYFDFRFGQASKGERDLDAQYWTATEYLGAVMGREPGVFGVNFADGRIKCYPRDRGRRGGASTHFVRYVRGNPDYGVNQFVDKGDGTISDLATGLMWTKADSGKGLNWQQALAWAESLQTAGHSDWRLPNAKELQSIVDYDRAPDARDAGKKGPAIDPIFQLSDPKGWYWTSTTHLEGNAGVYVAFGRAMGYFQDPRTGRRQYIDVHGAGAQRSDPKSGDPGDYPVGRGPQGDEIRIYNLARAVRNIDPDQIETVTPKTTRVAFGRGGRPNDGQAGGPDGGPDGEGRGNASGRLRPGMFPPARRSLPPMRRPGQ